MLSDTAIHRQRARGNIVIEPFVQEQLGPNSYDCRLGPWYFVGDDTLGVMDISDPETLARYWGNPQYAASGAIAISPGATILAHTLETIGGKHGYLAKMQCKSTIARSGLSVCRCAGVGDVGYISRWTMEITNHTHHVITVPVGYKICQFLFEYVGPVMREYHGHYGQGDWTPQDMVPKPDKHWVLPSQFARMIEEQNA